MESHTAYCTKLLDAGLLVATRVDGLYARSERFENIVDALNLLLTRTGADAQAVVMRFPPVIPRSVMVETSYLASFPTMTGSVNTFAGTDRDHAELLGVIDAGGDWSSLLVPTKVMLCSAACHPLYPTLTGILPAGGRRFDVSGWCFRHEPSVDPARMQAFRMHEFVFAGEAGEAEIHRDRWLQRGLQLLTDLELDVETKPASDLFFGRSGRLLAASQHDRGLKYEILAATSPGMAPTAIMSANCHLAHFGNAFGIFTADGDHAHSACAGFGLERIALALLFAHGFDARKWPLTTREHLWP